MVYPFVSGVLEVGTCLLSLVRSIAWLNRLFAVFDDEDPVLSVGVHHLLAIRWSGIVGFAYQFLAFLIKARGVLVDTDHIYGTWR
jgi:hypothetical protein